MADVAFSVDPHRDGLYTLETIPDREGKAVRHGKSSRNEGCVYCGTKRTKQRGGKPVCKSCRAVEEAGIPVRKVSNG